MSKHFFEFLFPLFSFFLGIHYSNAQYNDFSRIRVEVQFDQPIRVWDGFGFNYVEEAQYRDIISNRQDYGGFSYMNDKSKHEILEMIFGQEGLKPGLIKMFLDPFHQTEEGGPFDHKSYVALRK